MVNSPQNGLRWYQEVLGWITEWTSHSAVGTPGHDVEFVVEGQI
jgi:hypothetical protein